jgi:hypothetical protein
MVGVVMRRAYKDLEFDSLHLHPLKVPCAHIQTPSGQYPGVPQSNGTGKSFFCPSGVSVYGVFCGFGIKRELSGCVTTNLEVVGTFHTAFRACY